MREISRREALMAISKGKTISCVKEKSGKICKISTMEELQNVVNLEQKGLCDRLKFYED